MLSKCTKEPFYKCLSVSLPSIRLPLSLTRMFQWLLENCLVLIRSFTPEIIINLLVELPMSSQDQRGQFDIFKRGQFDIFKHI